MNQNEKINKDVENLKVSVDFIGQSIQGIIENEKLMMSTIKNINVNLKMYSFDHLRMYNIDHINTCCSRW